MTLKSEGTSNKSGDGSPRAIKVRHDKRNLLRGAHAGEEPEFIVVALRFAPVLVDRGDQRLSFLDRERIDDRPILALHTCALQLARRIVLLGVIA